MSPAPMTHPSPEQLKAYALGKLKAAELESIATHLESCSRCLEIAAGRHADSFVGKLRAAHPQAATAGWSPDELLPARAPDHGELVALPPELRDSKKYRILRELGRGGMGVIYLAEHHFMGKRVALKVISQALLTHPDAETRFLTEVRAAARLDHPNIVKALDADRLGTLHLLVMDYVDGKSLADVLQRKGPFPVVHACNYIRQAALGLQHAFEQGMVHRDIKPQNLMLTREGRVKVLDFGLARITRGQAPGKPGVTQVGDFMGTPEYVAPEQAMDASTADIRADLYSLGCTLYCLLAGQPPFRGDTAVQVIMSHLENEPPPLPKLRNDVPAQLWEVIARLLAKDPARRYQTPIEAAQALAPFHKTTSKQPAAEPPPAPPPPPSSPQAGTKVSSDTSKLPARRPQAPLVAPVVVPSPPPAPVEEGAVMRSSSQLRRPPLQRKKHALTTKLLACAGIAVMFLAAGAWICNGVLVRVVTSDGTLVIEVNQPGATVHVDGKKAMVTSGADGAIAEIQAEPGTHRVTVEKDGFKARSEEVTLRERGRVVLSVRMERTRAGAAPVPAAPPAPAVQKIADTGTAPAPAVMAEGFVPLFNGVDLTGWLAERSNGQHWRVEEGVLVARGAGPAQVSYLLSSKQYADFTLRLEFLLEQGCGSGIVLRGLEGESMPLKSGIRIFDHPLLKLADPGRFPTERTGTTHWVRNDEPNSSIPDGDTRVPGLWRPLEITVRGETCSAVLSGTKIVDIKLSPITGGQVIPALQRTKGHIGFQAHTGTARFRKVEIKELRVPQAPAPGNPPNPSAPALPDPANRLNESNAPSISTRAFDNIDRLQIKAALGTNPSFFVQDINDISRGTVVLFRTDENRLGKLLVLNADSDLEIRWVTYSADGSIFRQGERLVIKGSWHADLDYGHEGSDGKSLPDFWWRILNGNTRILAPKNGARFVVYRPASIIGSGKSLTLVTGKEATSWLGRPGYWTVREGAIVGAPAKGIKAHTFLCSDKTYKDFELKFKVRRKNGVGNTGVQIRSSILDPQQLSVRGPQVEIDAASNPFPPGSLLFEGGAALKQSYVKANADLIAKVWKEADFNEMSIRCVGKHVTVKISGLIALDTDFPSLPEEGIIAWQLHGGSVTILGRQLEAPEEVTFKDIELTNLTQ